MTRFALILSLMILGCANPNPHRVSDEHSATLQNRLVEKDNQRLSLLFEVLDGERLSPSWTTAQVDASFKAPAGERKLAVRIVQGPTRTLPATVAQLRDARATLSVKLIAGRTYVVDAEIGAGRATVWVKDASTGQSASEVLAPRLGRVNDVSRYTDDAWRRHIAAGNKAYEHRDLERAIRSFSEALEDAEELKILTGRPEADEMVAISLKNLGAARLEQGKHADAESYYKRALAVRESVLGAEHASVADIVNDLGTTYRSQGRLNEAQAHYERAVRIYEKAEQRPRLAMSLNNIGHLREAQGRISEAELDFRRALSVTEEAIGPNPKPDHPGFPQLVHHLRDYAASVRKAGRTGEAEQLDNRVTDAVRQTNEYSASLRKGGREAEAAKIEARVKEALSDEKRATNHRH